MMENEMIDDIEEIILTPEDIEREVSRLGREISADYMDKDPLLVGVLRGSTVFIADLIRHISLPVRIDFISISSYQHPSPGVVRIIKDLDEPITGKDIIIIEGIIDTGLSLGYLIRVLNLREPASLEICTLLDKPARRILALNPKYVGVEIPDKFVVGYGLDYNQKYRNLPFIGALKPEIYQGNR